MPLESTIRQIFRAVLPQAVRFGLRRVLFSGDMKRCPLCDSAVRTFTAHGGSPSVLERRQVVGGMMRLDDACPVCHGGDRARLKMLYLEQVLLTEGRRKRILHVAPEFGLYRRLRRETNIDYVATDLDQTRYRHIPELVAADLTDLPVDAGGFDVVICSHVLEHVPDDRKAMSEICRVLAPSGTTLLMVPLAMDGLGTDEDLTVTNARERDARIGQYDHLRMYGREDFADRLENVGFEVSYFNGFDQFPALADKLWLNPRENLILARPRASVG